MVLDDADNSENNVELQHDINETCFFQNDRALNEKAFENTRSHEALFQSSKGCTQLLDGAQQIGENFFTNQDMLKHIDNNGSFSYNQHTMA